MRVSQPSVEGWQPFVTAVAVQSTCIHIRLNLELNRLLVWHGLAKLFLNHCMLLHAPTQGTSLRTVTYRGVLDSASRGFIRLSLKAAYLLRTCDNVAVIVTHHRPRSFHLIADNHACNSTEVFADL